MIKTILLVEFDESLSQVLSVFLKDCYNIETHIVSSVDKGIEFLTINKQVDVVIINYYIPIEDEMEKIVLVAKQCPKCKIILVSTLKTIDDIVNTLGVDSGIRMPFTLEEFSVILENNL